MGEDKELERHNKVLEQIRNATTKEEVPSSTLSKVTKFIATNVYFDDTRLSQTEFKSVLDAILQSGAFVTPEVKKVFMEILTKNYPGRIQEEFEAQYEKMARASNINNYIIEAEARNAKLLELQKQANLGEHNQTLEQIRTSFELRDLPKVSKGVLNRKVQRATQNDFTDKFPIEIVNEISDDLLQGKTIEEVLGKIYEFCERTLGGDAHLANEMFEQIRKGFAMDETIAYTVEEVQKKDKRTLEI